MFNVIRQYFFYTLLKVEIKELYQIQLFCAHQLTIYKQILNIRIN